MRVLAIALVFLAAPAGAETLVLRGGKRIEAQAASVQGSMVVVTLASGKHVGYPVAMVDEPATALANPENPTFLARPAAPLPRPTAGPTNQDLAASVKLRETELVLEGLPVLAGAPSAQPPAQATPTPLLQPPLGERSLTSDFEEWPQEARDLVDTQPERALAIAFFDRECRRLRVVADEMDSKLRAWDGACQGTTTTGGAYVQGLDGQIAYVQSISIDNASTPYCRQLLVEARGAADRIRREMPEAFNNGRRMGLLPGDVRAATHRYGLDSRLWE